MTSEGTTPEDVDEHPISSPPRPRRLPLGGRHLTDRALDYLGAPVYVPVPLLDLPYRDDERDRRNHAP